MNLKRSITKSAAWVGSIAFATGLGYWLGRLDEDAEQRELDEDDVDEAPTCAPGRAAGPVIDIQAAAPPGPPHGGPPPGGAAGAAAVVAQLPTQAEIHQNNQRINRQLQRQRTR